MAAVEHSRPKAPLIYNPKVRSIAYQAVLCAVIVFLAWSAIHNAAENLARAKIASGFGFWDTTAGFDISQTLIEYQATSTYGRAFWVGLINTLVVAGLGIVLATILGFLIGIARLSKNWLLAQCARVYVEVMRNIPLLLQIIFWWAVFRESLPGPRDAIDLGGSILVSNRGFKYPVPVWEPALWPILIAFFAGIAGSWWVARWARVRQEATGEQFPVFGASVGMILGLPLLVWLATGMPGELSRPVLRGFNFVGGGTMTPEFAALLIGLVVYTAAFIAEIVRSGIQAVAWGQWEAAGALGVRRGRIMRLVVLPQALRVIIPPMTSQYLNITKNSSLAVAIGYPEIVSIAGTTLNQTGQAIEGVAIIMAVYLTISLSISLFMNWYNRAIALVER